MGIFVGVLFLLYHSAICEEIYVTRRVGLNGEVMYTCSRFGLGSGIYYFIV